MSFIHHPDYETIKTADLERAAGLLEIDQLTERDDLARAQMSGASCILRVMATKDAEDPAHLVRLFKLYMFGEIAEERSEGNA